MKLVGVKYKMSTAYYPQTDGALEQINKTIIQSLWFYIDCNQLGWSHALPKVCFNIMNMINSSTGYAPFVLKSGHHPQFIPPITTLNPLFLNNSFSSQALEFIKTIKECFVDAQDALLAAKIDQAHHANTLQSPETHYEVGQWVLLSTVLNWRHDYMQAKDGRTVKFMPHYNGSYKVIQAFSDSSNYTLKLLTSSKVHSTFHVSLLKSFQPNNTSGLVLTDAGNEEYVIKKIVDQQRRGGRMQYLVHWLGYDKQDDLWKWQDKLEECEALDIWLALPESR